MDGWDQNLKMEMKIQELIGVNFIVEELFL